MDVSTQIKLLTKHSEKIDEKDFDLEAWKSTASTLVERFFGKNDPRITSIEGLKIDYGSWALRDASSKYDPVSTCKRKARDIMELSIAELSDGSETETQVLEELANELTGAQLKEIKKIVEGKSKPEEKQKALVTKLKALKAPLLAGVVANLIIKG